MKGLVITLAIMALLYLMLFREQTKQMGPVSDPSDLVDASQQLDTPSMKPVKPLQPYQQQLDMAKGVEAMLNQGVEDRMRNIDGLEAE